MNTFWNRLKDLWFEPAPAQRLAFLRIAVGLYALWYLGQRIGMYDRIARSSADLFAPVGLAAWLSAPLSPELFSWIVTATLLCGVAFTVGWKYRITGPAFGLLLLFTLCYRNSWTMIYHNDNALVVHALIIGLTAAADAWSVDAWRTRLQPRAHSWVYGWPVKLVCASTLLTYFVAGYAKVVGDLGWSWALGSSLRSQVAVDALRKELLGAESSPLAYMLYDQIEIFTLIGVASLAIELGAPLALFSRRIGWFWAVNTFFMHWGIFFIMDIRFRYQMAGIIFLSFFPAEKIGEAAIAGAKRLSAAVRRPSQATAGTGGY